MTTDSDTPRLSKQGARDQRRAAALRENLRRRKSQARARADSGRGTAAKPRTVRGLPRESEP